jgi:hypothetical protein
MQFVATESTCSGARSSGDVSFYCGKKHLFDQGNSGSQEWHDAVARDFCVSDAYSNSNYVEDVAQVVVVWFHLVGNKWDQNLGGNQFVCMKNQLQLMRKYLPESSIKN